MTNFTIAMLLAGILLPTQQEPRKKQKKNNDGPWNHKIHFAVSRDSLEWKEVRTPLAEKASVPDIVQLEQDSPAGKRGTLLVYAVSFEEPVPEYPTRIGVWSSGDGGKTWSGMKRLGIKGGNLDGRAVDPSIVPLPGGNLRLYFYDMAKRKPSNRNDPYRAYSAVSRDGVTFTVERGIRFESAVPMTDPEVIRWKDEWLMFFAQKGSVGMARSKDGMEFELVEGFRIPDGGIPGAIALPDGRVRVYCSTRKGITSVTLDPETGKSREDEGVRIRPGVADPAVWQCEDGAYVMMVKRWMSRKKPGK